MKIIIMLATIIFLCIGCDTAWLIRMIPVALIILCIIELCHEKVKNPKLWVGCLLISQINVFVAAIRAIMEG